MGGICSSSDTAAGDPQRPEKWGRHASLRRMDNSITGSHLPVNMSGANETADDLSPVSRHSGSPTNRSQMLRKIAHLREALSDLRELVGNDAALLVPEKGATQVARDELARKTTQNEVSKTLLAGRVYDLLHDDKRGLDVKQLQDEFARVGWMTGALELVSSLGKPREAWNDDVSPVSPTECTDEGLVNRKSENAAGSAKSKNLLSPPPRRAIGVHTLSSDDLTERLHHTGSSSPRNLGGISRERFVDEFMQVTFELGVQCLDSEPSVESECPSPTRRRHLLLQKEKPAVLRNYKIQPFCHYPKRIKCIRNQKDSPLIAICMKDSLTAQMYNTVTGECERDYTGHCDCIFDMSISQDRKYLATASRDATLIIWDLVCGFLVKQFSHPGAVTCCQFGSGHEVCTECCNTHPNPWLPQILSGCYDSAIRKYDLNKGLLKGHETLIWMLHFRPRANEHMLSVCEKRINVWHEVEKEALEKHSSKLQCTIQIGTGGRCGDSKNTKQSWLSAQFLQKPYDAHIIASSYDLAISIHEVTTGAQILHFYHRYPIYCISSPQDDSCPYFGDSAGNVLTFCPS